MLRGLIALALLLFATSVVEAQLPVNLKDRSIIRYDLKQRDQIQPLAGDEEPFVLPSRSLIKLNRQASIQFLPDNFLPAVEDEKAPFRQRALRYAIAYYRECEVPGFLDFVDVLVGLRFDTRNGELEVRYTSVVTIINTKKLQFTESVKSLAVLPGGEGSAMVYLMDGEQRVLVTFEGIFTETPHPVGFLSGSDFEGIQSDEGAGKFAVFVRGGDSRASLFVINTDINLKDIQTFEVFRDLPASDRAYIFQILPAAIPFRGAAIR